MEEISMKRSWHSRDWSRLVKLFNGLTFYERFEQAIILILIALIMLVTAIATVHLISAVCFRHFSNCSELLSQRTITVIISDKPLVIRFGFF
ncbi:hypothetical protein CSR02_08285 [Acetobacter pomorum]|uniref:Uncharacterized protein n=1 Tax=Acetobacter pomorum TaxID=65959 RepID=A0A2G4RBV0_9PROT|nr:hypothetical protein CSR02_08285 [Acetobacter pomorum]